MKSSRVLQCSTIVMAALFTKLTEGSMYHTGAYPYKPHEYELFVPKTPCNIGNETILRYFLHHGIMDIDLKLYLPTKLKAIMNEYKMYYYSPKIVSRDKLNSDNRDDNYEYFNKTNRLILQGVNEWYLNLQHTVKVNTLLEMKHDYFRASNYTYEGSDPLFDECQDKEIIGHYWTAEDVFRESLANVTRPFRERIRLQILKQTLKPYQYWHNKYKKNDSKLKYSVEEIVNYGLPIGGD